MPDQSSTEKKIISPILFIGRSLIGEGCKLGDSRNPPTVFRSSFYSYVFRILVPFFELRQFGLVSSVEQAYFEYLVLR